MRWPGDRLAVRLAIVGALQVVVLLMVAALSVPLWFYFQDKTSPQGIVRGVAHAITDEGKLRAHLARVRASHQIDLSVYDDAGTLVGSNVEPPLEVRQKFAGLRRPAAPPPFGFGEPPDVAPLPPFVEPPFGRLGFDGPGFGGPGFDGPPPGAPPFEHALSPSDLNGVPPPNGSPPSVPPLGDRLQHRPWWPLGLPLLEWVFGDGPREPPVMVVPLHEAEREYLVVMRFPRHNASLVPLLITLVGGVIVVSLGATLTARVVTSPLERLSHAVSAFGAGQLTARSDVKRRDEVGVLAAAFNQMADRISALRAAERDLLNNVAHELRTPLSRIRVALEIAEESDGVTAQRTLLGIREDLGELETLIDDVLTASRLESTVDGANLVLRSQPLVVAELVSSVHARFAAHHPARPVVIDDAARGATLDGDPVLLRRALGNLVENAHKYTPDGGQPISVRVTATEGNCLIAVSDCGIGMDAEDQAKVFLPFYRTEQSRSRATGGVGLGLTLAKRITEAHGGTIAIESTLGVGTTVRLELPLLESPSD